MIEANDILSRKSEIKGYVATAKLDLAVKRCIDFFQDFGIDDDDEAVLFPAVKKIRTAGYKIQDVYTPFAVHGLDHALGMRETSLHTAGFIYGVAGTTTALSTISWIFTKDWPLNIGGKPHFALPAWIPIIFIIIPCYLQHIFNFSYRNNWKIFSE